MRPLTEHHDSTLLCCVKEKVKILQPRTTLLWFFIDEIHIQQFLITQVVGTAKKSAKSECFHDEQHPV